MLGEATTPRGKSYMAVVGKEKAQKELLIACLPFLRSHAHASLGLSTTLPSLDALPLGGSFREPSPFDCTVLILHTDLHTEPLPLSSVTLNPERSSGCQASGSSELHREFPASPDRLSPNFSRELYLRVQSRSSTVLLTPGAPSTTKTLARSRYDLGECRCSMFGGGKGSRRKEARKRAFGSMCPGLYAFPQRAWASPKLFRASTLCLSEASASLRS